MSYKSRRLPNGFGSISKLSGNRRRPYMVRTSKQEILGYTETYEDAYLMLCEYNKSPWNTEYTKMTVSDIWKIFCELEIDRYSPSTQKRYKSIFNKYLSRIANEVYSGFKTYHFMLFIDSLNCSDNMQSQVMTLLKHFDDVAYQMDIIDKKYAHELRCKGFEPKKERVPFTEEEIDILWDNVNHDFVNYILIMIYTGTRRNELVELKIGNIDTEEWTIRCGSKTKAGRNRIIPIHERIRPLVMDIINKAESDAFFPGTSFYFWRKFKETTLELLGKEHIPHEARHTLRTRLDRVGANKVAIDRILGHKSGDTGMDVYTHKSVFELHEAIELLD